MTIAVDLGRKATKTNKQTIGKFPRIVMIPSNHRKNMQVPYYTDECPNMTEQMLTGMHSTNIQLY